MVTGKNSAENQLKMLSGEGSIQRLLAAGRWASRRMFETHAEYSTHTYLGTAHGLIGRERGLALAGRARRQNSGTAEAACNQHARKGSINPRWRSGTNHYGSVEKCSYRGELEKC